MKAQTGREWDDEKDQKDFEKPRYGDRAARGEPDQDLRIYEWRDENEKERDSQRGRGRGRGRGDRGRGRGRGPAIQATPKAEDFPALPGAKTSPETIQGTSWADQMAA
ncbi:hypothetical protein LTR66_014457 [Elasticomyces elasticus]|nr:hypothetical protein LTR66_014457 [Elasticomyces elasticus]